MTFEQWWREHGKDYWGAPVFAAQDAWNARERSHLEFKRRVLNALNQESPLALDTCKLRRELAAELEPPVIPKIQG